MISKRVEEKTEAPGDTLPGIEREKRQRVRFFGHEQRTRQVPQIDAAQITRVKP